jgi:hypothetical protein
MRPPHKVTSRRIINKAKLQDMIIDRLVPYCFSLAIIPEGWQLCFSLLSRGVDFSTRIDRGVLGARSSSE